MKADMPTEHRETNNKVNFLVVGTQKGGTSALYYYLRKHSELELPAKKELHFFDNDALFNRDSNDYRQYHDNFLPQAQGLRGECTPIYMYWRPAMQRIFDYNPDMKLIALLRDPIDRAFSHWNKEQQQGHEADPFNKAIRLEQLRLTDASSVQHRRRSYIDRGFYSHQILRIWQHFPKHQTLFLKSEVLKNAPTEALNKVTNFLGVSPFTSINKATIHARAYTNSINKYDYALLNTLFQDDVKRVESLLDWNLNEWLKR